MIVFVARTLLLVLWTIIVRRELRQLSRERNAAQHGWLGDLFISRRNRRAVLLFALWSAIVALWFGGLSYVDLSFLDVGRLAGSIETMLLLVVGVALLRSWGSRE